MHRGKPVLKAPHVVTALLPPLITQQISAAVTRKLHLPVAGSTKVAEAELGVILEANTRVTIIPAGQCSSYVAAISSMEAAPKSIVLTSTKTVGWTKGALVDGGNAKVGEILNRFIKEPSQVMSASIADMLLLAEYHLAALSKEEREGTPKPFSQYSYIFFDGVIDHTTPEILCFLTVAREILIRGTNKSFPKIILPATLSQLDRLREYFGPEHLLATPAFLGMFDGLTTLSYEALGGTLTQRHSAPFNDKLNFDSMTDWANKMNTWIPTVLQSIVTALASEQLQRSPVIIVLRPKEFKFINKGVKDWSASQKILPCEVTFTMDNLDDDAQSDAKKVRILILSDTFAFMLPKLRKLPVVAVIDLGMSTMSHSYGGDSPLTFQRNEWSPLEQVEQRALAANGSLHIRLVPASLVSVPSKAIPMPPRILLTYLKATHSNVTSELSPFIYSASLIYPLNLLKSLGMVSPNPPFVPTALGELVDHLPDTISIEAGYIAVVMAALGLPELGAAIATAATLGFSKDTQKARIKYSALHKGPHANIAASSDLLTDTLYFLAEMQHFVGPKQQPQLEEFSDSPGWLVTFFRRIRSQMKSLSFVKAAMSTQEGTIKCVEEVIHEFHENDLLAASVISAAYMHSATLWSDMRGAAPSTEIVPLSFHSANIFAIQSMAEQNYNPWQGYRSSLAVAESSTIVTSADFSYVAMPLLRGKITQDKIEMFKNTAVPKNVFFAAIQALHPTTLCNSSISSIRVLTQLDRDVCLGVSDLGSLLSLRVKINRALQLLWLRLSMPEASASTIINREAFDAYVNTDTGHVIADAKTHLVSMLVEARNANVESSHTTDVDPAGPDYLNSSFVFDSVMTATTPDVRSYARRMATAEQAHDDDFLVIACKTTMPMVSKSTPPIIAYNEDDAEEEVPGLPRPTITSSIQSYESNFYEPSPLNSSARFDPPAASSRPTSSANSYQPRPPAKMGPSSPPNPYERAPASVAPAANLPSYPFLRSATVNQPPPSMPSSTSTRFRPSRYSSGEVPSPSGYADAYSAPQEQQHEGDQQRHQQLPPSTNGGNGYQRPTSTYPTSTYAQPEGRQWPATGLAYPSTRQPQPQPSQPQFSNGAESFYTSTYLPAQHIPAPAYSPLPARNVTAQTTSPFQANTFEVPSASYDDRSGRYSPTDNRRYFEELGTGPSSSTYQQAYFPNSRGLGDQFRAGAGAPYHPRPTAPQQMGYPPRSSDYNQAGSGSTNTFQGTTHEPDSQPYYTALYRPYFDPSSNLGYARASELQPPQSYHAPQGAAHQSSRPQGYIPSSQR